MSKQSIGAKEGFVYLLYDGISRLSKIGCTTRADGSRQRAIMGAHATVLVNVMNARVEDCRAAEAQCHKHFAKHRRNGEWFDAPYEEIGNYISEQIDWINMDVECHGRLFQYVYYGMQGDIAKMKDALRRAPITFAPAQPNVNKAMEAAKKSENPFKAMEKRHRRILAG